MTPPDLEGITARQTGSHRAPRCVFLEQPEVPMGLGNQSPNDAIRIVPLHSPEAQADALAAAPIPKLVADNCL